MLLLKILLIALLLIVFFQDTKTRMVYWFLYPMIGIAAVIAQCGYNNYVVVVVNSAFNLAFIAVIIFTCYLYSRIKLRQPFDEVFGIGDVLFFIFIAFGFSIISFITLFISSLLFSLLLHLIIKNRQSIDNVPLAGYMALFFAMVYTFGLTDNFDMLLYAY